MKDAELLQQAERMSLEELEATTPFAFQLAKVIAKKQGAKN